MTRKQKYKYSLIHSTMLHQNKSYIVKLLVVYPPHNH